ncbi:hypothetical protein SO802_028580 [Lithocarpus litseifolius]|uniref:Uncharacterized protein n=1 Tax=Lithocarpus litseifolius TaxID=425828 RepID=A0AAW2BQY7_9ROSI
MEGKEKGKGKGLAMQFEIALFALTSATTMEGIRAEWNTIKVPDPECPPPSSSPNVTTIRKPLQPFSKVLLAWAYREHAVIGSRLYSFGGMNPDSEPFTDVDSPEFVRFLKVRSFDLSTPDDGWKPVATVTFPKRFEPPSVVLDDKLYVFGSVSASEVEAKGNGFSPHFLAYYAAIDSKKQILIAQQEAASLFATFYLYHVVDRCWTLLEPPKRKLRPFYHDPVRGRQSTVVDNTIYWGFLLDGFVRVQSHNIDTDLYFHGRLDAKPIFEDGEFADEYSPKLPLLHVADKTFCLLTFTFFQQKMEEEDSDFDFEENGIIFLNCIVLDISLDPFKDEGKQKSKEDLHEICKYNFFGDSSKQLNISLVSVQKDRPTDMPMKKKPKLSHETSVMIKDNLRDDNVVHVYVARVAISGIVSYMHSRQRISFYYL